MDSPRVLNIVAVNDGRLEVANLSALQDILLSKRYADMPVRDAFFGSSSAFSWLSFLLLEPCVKARAI